MNRWLSALDYLVITQTQLIPESGAMGTMLAQVLRAIGNDHAHGHSSDLYRESYSTKAGAQWLGLGFA
jgi:hypothetical protein